MSTAIIARRLEAPANTASEQSSLKAYWKSILALFPARKRSEKFDRLIAHYRMLPLEVRTSDANQETTELIEAIRLQTAKRQPSWSDVDAVDRALLTMLSGEDLRRLGWALRAEFQRATGAVPGDEVLLKAYLHSNPPEGVFVWGRDFSYASAR